MLFLCYYRVVEVFATTIVLVYNASLHRGGSFLRHTARSSRLGVSIFKDFCQDSKLNLQLALLLQHIKRSEQVLSSSLGSFSFAFSLRIPLQILRILHSAKGCPVSKVSHRLVGLVVKASASRAEDPGFESRLRRDFFGVESYQ